MLPPQSTIRGPLTRGPSICHVPRGAPHVAPHTFIRVDTRGLLPRVRALCATYASRRARAARPHGLACRIASARVPCASSAQRATSAPHATLAWGMWNKITPFFAILSIKIQLKIKLKIRKKGINFINSYL